MSGLLVLFIERQLRAPVTVRYSHKMIYRFLEHTLDTGSYVLSSGGDNEVPVEPQVFDLLVYLVEHRERVVTRKELLDKLWPGKVVTDAALSARLKAARKAVGDSGREQKVIKTIHGRGYQFVANVDRRQEVESDEQLAVAQHSSIATPDLPSVAVLPFQNLSGDRRQDWFAEAMSQEIANALSRTTSLYVVANYVNYDIERESANLKQLARDQGIHFMLDGSVLRSGDRVRIHAQLSEVDTGLQKWADRYDTKFEDVFTVQDEITKNIIVALHIKLSHGMDADTWAKGTDNVEAWTCVVRGFDHIDRADKQGMLEGRRLAQQAIELDPDYVSAWTLLTFSYADEAYWEWTAARAELLEKGFEAARRGQDLGPNDPNHLAALADMYMANGDFDEAVVVAERAVARGPHSMDSLAMSGLALARVGQLERALKRVEKAIRYTPVFPPWVTIVLGICHLLTGRTRLAVSVLKEGVDRSPESPSCIPWLIAALIEDGALDEARSMASNLLQLEPDFRARPWSQRELKEQAKTQALAQKLTQVGIPV